MSDSKDEIQSTVARWKSTLETSACGPLIIAQEVVGLAAKWKSAVAFSSFLRTELGRGHTLKRFRDWAHCVEVLGKESKRTFDARAAVWLAGAVPMEKVAPVMAAMFRFKRESNNSNVISLAMAQRIAKPMLGRAARRKTPKACERCQALEAMLKAKGMKLPN